VQRPGVEPTRLMQPEKVRVAELPMYRPASFSRPQTVPLSPYADFSMLHPLPYKVGIQLGGRPSEICASCRALF
jgi:hypothetical protein